MRTAIMLFMSCWIWRSSSLAFHQTIVTKRPNGEAVLPLHSTKTSNENTSNNIRFVNADDDQHQISTKNGRRKFLSNFVSTTAASIAGTTTILSTTLFVQPSNAAAADDILFKKNPLTNPILEQIRIWEQAEADNIKYGGELERGDAGNQGKVEAYPRLLVPILQIAYDIDKINSLLQSPSGYKEASQILQQSKYDKIQFKRIFNAYADNIYYSDPDRANVYLAGGALPKIEQSLAYLLRNEILSNIENLRAEIDYCSKNPSEPLDDLILYASSANTAMTQYLEVVPPAELRKAKELLGSVKA